VPRFDRTTGRYLHLEVAGLRHRVYFEECGQGVPLLLQHTAGSDGKQWRHLLEDRELTERFRVIAWDPPTTEVTPARGRALVEGRIDSPCGFLEFIETSREWRSTGRCSWAARWAATSRSTSRASGRGCAAR
jgi:pimeloyl-ACP methyl ester carboxylesterase